MNLLQINIDAFTESQIEVKSDSLSYICFNSSGSILYFINNLQFKDALIGDIFVSKILLEPGIYSIKDIMSKLINECTKRDIGIDNHSISGKILNTIFTLVAQGVIELNKLEDWYNPYYQYDNDIQMSLVEENDIEKAYSCINKTISNYNNYKENYIYIVDPEFNTENLLNISWLRKQIFNFNGEIIIYYHNNEVIGFLYLSYHTNINGFKYARVETVITIKKGCVFALETLNQSIFNLENQCMQVRISLSEEYKCYSNILENIGFEKYGEFINSISPIHKHFIYGIMKEC